MPIHKDTRAYNATQSAGDKRICDALARAIDRRLPDAENKIWHRHPIVVMDLKRWLEKSIEIQWDYKNIVKRKGKLERLK